MDKLTFFHKFPFEISMDFDSKTFFIRIDTVLDSGVYALYLPLLKMSVYILVVSL